MKVSEINTHGGKPPPLPKRKYTICAPKGTAHTNGDRPVFLAGGLL